MGARGRTKTLGSRMVVRFPRDVEVQLRILARTEGVDSMAGFIRELVSEGLRARVRTETRKESREHAQAS